MPDKTAWPRNTVPAPIPPDDLSDTDPFDDDEEFDEEFDSDYDDLEDELLDSEYDEDDDLPY